MTLYLYFRIIPPVTKALVERLSVLLFCLKNGDLAFKMLFKCIIHLKNKNQIYINMIGC